MDYTIAISRIISTGIEAAKRDYVRTDQQEKLDGSIAGFNACAGKQPHELLVVLTEATQRQNEAHRERYHNYWWFACYATEVEWVCNVVGAIMLNEGLEPIVSPTCRGVLHAHRILQSNIQ